MKEIRWPKKSQIPIRRIILGTVSYTIIPSFEMPYYTAFTIDVEKALFFRKFDALLCR